jgi:hypothetical protein
MQIHCPHCHSGVELRDGQAREVVCSACGSSIELDPAATRSLGPGEAPRWLGRFDIREQLGAGAFGTVYKARDRELDRLVAI